MRKQLILMSIILAGFFLNSCAVIPIVAGGGTLACVTYEVHTDKHVEKERCPAVVAIDEGYEKWKSSNILIDVN